MWRSQRLADILYRSSPEQIKRPWDSLVPVFPSKLPSTWHPASRAQLGPPERSTRSRDRNTDEADIPIILADWIKMLHSQLAHADEDAAKLTASHVYNLSKEFDVRLEKLMQKLDTAEARSMVLAYAPCAEALIYCQDVNEDDDHPCHYKMMTEVSNGIAGNAQRRTRRDALLSDDYRRSLGYSAKDVFKDHCSSEYLDKILEEADKFMTKYRLNQDEMTMCYEWLNSEEKEVSANLLQLSNDPQFKKDILHLRKTFANYKRAGLFL